MTGPRRHVGVNERWRQLAWLSLAELSALSLWFSASAVLPALAREWQLGDAGRAWLTNAVQLGFIVGTLGSALANLPDVWSPRRLMMVSALAGGVANAAVALWVDSLGPALALRFVTGVCMAGAYPPAMKIMATWFREGRGLAIGILVGALTVGSAAPHLIRGVTDLPWRHTLLAATVLAFVAAAIVARFVDEGPYRFPSARFDLRMAAAVFRERGARLACLGYFGHMWELYAMWAWIAAFLADSLAARGGGSYGGLNASAAAFAVIASGALGCWLGGIVSDRWGRTTSTIAAMAVSGLCALLIGLTFGGPPGLTLLRAVLHGGDRALAAGLRRHGADDPDLRGLRDHDGLDLARAAHRPGRRLALGLRRARRRPPLRCGGHGAPARAARGRQARRRTPIATSLDRPRPSP